MMKSRKPLKITGRSSTITNAFVQAIIPYNKPSDFEIQEILDFFGMSRDNVTCVYCGDKSTDWDHLNPLVKNKRPTGHLSIPKNMVPACAPCNQSKSGADWETWISSNAKNSPKSRKIQGLIEKTEKLKLFQSWSNIKSIEFDILVSEEKWNSYWEMLKEIQLKLIEAQKLAEEIKLEIEENYGFKNG